MEVTQSFNESGDPTFTFTPIKPGFFGVSVFLTDANGHRALLSAQTLCVMEPGVETASSMMWTLARAAVDEAVTPGMTDREKAVALHDWVTTHFRYSFADMAVFTDYETWTSDYLTLNTLVLNEGVCSDYARVYALLCFLADIRCFVVDS